MNIIPRIVRLKDRPKPLEPNQEVSPSYWWENDEYTKIKRYWCINWLGKNLIRVPYFETIKGNYFIPAKDTVAVLKELKAKGLISGLNDSSRVLEPGCNVGRNLFYIQEAFGCEVHGIDISEKALEIAKNDIWADRKMCHFTKDNVLTTPYFDQFEDNYFDLIFTRWHLIHVEKTQAKIDYIDRLKRIAKSVVFLEPVQEGRSGVEKLNSQAYCLSWDDWAKDYGLNLYESDVTAPLYQADKTKVFYYSK